MLFVLMIAVTQGLPGLLHGGQLPGGGGVTAVGMDVDAAVDSALADPAESLTATSRWTNLNTFSGRGGKLIFWHGVSDPWFSALDTVDYYERMTKANGGPEQVRNFSRLYLVPGAGHCGGGPALDTFDALSAIVRWVEQGVAPELEVPRLGSLDGREDAAVHAARRSHATPDLAGAARPLRLARARARAPHAPLPRTADAPARPVRPRRSLAPPASRPRPTRPARSQPARAGILRAGTTGRDPRRSIPSPRRPDGAPSVGPRGRRRSRRGAVATR